MSTAAKMEKELDAVAQKMRETVSRLERKVRSDKRVEFDSEKRGAFSALREIKESIAALKSEPNPNRQISDAPFLFGYVNRLGSPIYARLSQDEKRLLLSLRNESERFDRKRQLLSPSSEDEFLKSLWWLSQRGRNQDLDLLNLIRASRLTHERLQIVAWAEQEIVKRENEELLEFFNFDSAQFLQVIDATVARSQNPLSPYSKNLSIEDPTRVIRSLQEVKERLQEQLGPSEIEQWLKTSNRRYDGRSPRENLLTGHTFKIVYSLTNSNAKMKERRFCRRFAGAMLGLTSIMVLVGMFPLAKTAIGFGMAFGGALLAYECYLLYKAFGYPSPREVRNERLEIH